MQAGRARNRLAATITTAMAVAMLAGCAEEKPPSAFETAFDDADRPWTEVEAQLPSPPAVGDLMDFSVSGATQYRFQLDSKALTIGSDGVYRYTLIATSAQGARNVSYEGIRCGANQRKIYAIGKPDGTWVKARNAAWIPIEDVGLNRQHAALEREYFCPDGYAARDTKTIIARLHPSLAPSEATFDRQGQSP